MGVIGISFIVVSVVWVLFRPPSWIPSPLQILLRWKGDSAPAITESERRQDAAGSGAGAGPRVLVSEHHEVEPDLRHKPDPAGQLRKRTTATSSDNKSPGAQTGPPQSRHDDNVSMPPPPLPRVVPPPPTIAEHEEQTTPKASASNPPSHVVPSFSLDAPSTLNPSPAPLRVPSVRGPAPSIAVPSRSSMMPPPPLGRLPPSDPAVPSAPSGLAQFPAANSAQRARGPVPNRGPASSSGLAPPPTHSSRPSKPNRKVLLTPGHSPLDWARVSGPNADLRGVPGQTPYLRVTPSMLKRQTGRHGKDAWMALNGKVYNITPYADFHPGGVPELMRGAGRDGTRLFGEIHPWVNYETMLTACLVGLLVEESENSKQSDMEQMD